MSRNRDLKVALVGAGWVSLNRHLPSLRRTPGVSVVGIVDRREDRVREMAAKHDLPRWAVADSLESVEWLGEADAVVVGLPPMAHHAAVSQALRRGLNVLTEKPFAMTPEEGRDLTARAREAGKTLAVVHNFQFSRAWRQLERDIRRGRLGRPRAFEAVQLSNPQRRLPSWYESLPGGLFYDESPHLLYLLRRLGGGNLTIRRAVAVSDRERNTPDMLSVIFEAGVGIPARMSLNFVAPISEWQVAVYGESGLGVVDVFRDIYVRLPNDGLHVGGTVLRTSALATLHHWSGHMVPGLGHLLRRNLYGNLEVMSRFAESCRTGVAPEGISAPDALAVLSLQHEVLAAAGLA